MEPPHSALKDSAVRVPVGRLPPRCSGCGARRDEHHAGGCARRDHRARDAPSRAWAGTGGSRRVRRPAAQPRLTPGTRASSPPRLRPRSAAAGATPPRPRGRCRPGGARRRPTAPAGRARRAPAPPRRAHPWARRRLRRGTGRRAGARARRRRIRIRAAGWPRGRQARAGGWGDRLMQKIAVEQARRDSEKTSKDPALNESKNDDPLDLLNHTQEMEGIVKGFGLTAGQRWQGVRLHD